jgi:hypothetical protein
MGKTPQDQPSIKRELGLAAALEAVKASKCLRQLNRLRIYLDGSLIPWSSSATESSSPKVPLGVKTVVLLRRNKF